MPEEIIQKGAGGEDHCKLVCISYVASHWDSADSFVAAGGDWTFRLTNGRSGLLRLQHRGLPDIHNDDRLAEKETQDPHYIATGSPWFGSGRFGSYRFQFITVPVQKN